MCNAYLRHMPSAFDRLLWTIALLARNGFLVVPVSQLEQDPTLMEDRTLWAEVGPSASCSRYEQGVTRPGRILRARRWRLHCVSRPGSCCLR